MSTDKPIATLNALIALGIDKDAAARVVREVTNQAGQIQSRLDKLNATKAQKSMELWAMSVKEAGGVSKLTVEQSSRLVYEIERLTKAGAKVPVALQPAIDSMNKLREAEKNAAEASALKSGLLEKAGMGSLAGMGPAAGALLAVGAAAGVAKETYDLIDATAELADKIQDVATKYQISTDDAQTFLFMAERTGLTVDDFGAAIVNLTKNLDAAPEKFQQWGMDVEHLKSLQPAELLGEMSAKLQTLNESDRLTFAKELMKGVELLPALLGGFDELVSKARELGINLSSSDIESLNGLRDSLDDVGTAWDGMWTQLGAALAQDEAVRDFFDTFKDGIIELARLIKENKNEIVGFAKLMAGAATFNPVLAFKGLKGMVTGPEPTTYEWGTDPTIDPKKKPGQHKPDPAASKRAADEAEKSRRAQERLALEYSRFLTESAQLDTAAAEATAKAISGIQAKVSARINDGLANGPLATGAGAAGRAMLVEENRKAAEEWAWENNQSGIYDFRGPREEVKEVETSWTEFLGVAAHQFQLMGASGQALAKIVGGMGGIGAIFGEGGALKGVSGVKSFFSGGLDLKKLSGGLSAAFAAFDMGKLIFNMFHKTEVQKVAFDVGRDYGVKISEGLSKEIAKSSKTMGREAASLMSLDKIIGEAGGVSAFGVEKTGSKLRELFSMIQTGKMTAEQAKKPFDALFGELAQASISKTTGMISVQVRELMALANASGMKSDALDKFRNEQRDIASTILDRLTNNKDFKVANEQSGAALGASFAAQYRRMVEQGLSGKEIADKLGPMLERLQKKFDDSGFGGGKAFADTMGKIQLFNDELTGPTAQSIQDVTALATALYNSGDLTRDQFTGLAGQIGTDFSNLQAQLESQGRAPEEAFSLMAGDLQKLWEMQRRYGVTLDEQTQSILTQAEASGTVGEAQMSAQDRMAEGIDRLGEIMQRVGEQLGASFDDLPSRARTAAAGVSDALAGIKSPDLTGKLNLPNDMGPYSGGAMSGKLSEALAQLSSGENASITGESVVNGLAPEMAAQTDALINGLAAIIANMPQPVIQLDTGQLVGGVADRIERGGNARDRMKTALDL